MDIRPFGEAELVTSDRSRFDDLWSVLDRASFLGFPARSGGYFEKYRYYPVGDFDAYFSVGIGRLGRPEPEPWCWVRISADAHLGLAQQEAIKAHRPDAEQDGNSLLVPLVLEPGLSGYELTESLRAQLVVIACQIRDGLRKELAKTDRAVVQADDKVLAPLYGMRAFTAAELLDSDPGRREDIERVLDQVCSAHLRRRQGQVDRPRRRFREAELDQARSRTGATCRSESPGRRRAVAPAVGLAIYRGDNASG